MAIFLFIDYSDDTSYEYFLSEVSILFLSNQITLDYVARRLNTIFALRDSQYSFTIFSFFSIVASFSSS